MNVWARTGLTVVCLALLGSNALGIDKKEHQVLADSALRIVLRECSPFVRENLSAGGCRFLVEPWGLTAMKLTFGEISAADDANDMSPSRFHERGKTILQQLEKLDSAQIASIVRQYVVAESRIPSATSASGVILYPSALTRANVIQNYVICHLIALQYAHLNAVRIDRRIDILRIALIYEAMAQSYLSDAFSSGHMLVPLADAFARLHPINNEEAHDYYGSVGCYVLNSRGEVWRTFGDGLVQWYDAPFDHMLEASCHSLREIFLVYYATSEGDIPQMLIDWLNFAAEGSSASDAVSRWTSIQNGSSYYSAMRMPTLLVLPMPVAATWSIRTDEKDSHGMHMRKHYPQLMKPECHDPDLEGLNSEFLYSAESMPGWLAPPFLGLTQRTINDLIRNDSNLASVRYVDEGFYPPSYVGLFWNAGVWESFASQGSAYSVALGYAPKWALVPDIPFLNNLSGEVSYCGFANEERRRMLSLAVGLSFDLHISRISPTGLFRPLESIRIDGGYGWGLRSPFLASGGQCSLSLESGIIPLGFTYAGITLRLRYQAMFVEKTIHGLGFTLTVH